MSKKSSNFAAQSCVHQQNEVYGVRCTVYKITRKIEGINV